MQATPTDTIRAIKAMQCSPDNVAAVLSALETAYGEWLLQQDLLGHPRAPRGTGYGQILSAFEMVDDFASWLAGARRAA
jgi:hypothetical protein